MAVPEAVLKTKPLSYVSMDSVIASTLFVINIGFSIYFCERNKLPS